MSEPTFRFGYGSTRLTWPQLERTLTVQGLQPEVIDRVYFGFNNPISGQNTCTPLADPGPLKVTCQIPPRGNTVTATFEVSFRNQNDGNSYCDLIDTFGGEQTKAIREKLRC